MSLIEEEKDLTLLWTKDPICNIAQKELGTKESPKNSNLNKYGKWFGFNGVPWCAIFVSYCYYMAGFPIKWGGWSKGVAGCQVMYAKAKKLNLFTTTPVAGDIVLFDWNGDNRYDHTGLFLYWVDEDHFYTIEGNTSAGNNSNGGEVQKRLRNKNICKFINNRQL